MSGQSARILAISLSLLIFAAPSLFAGSHCKSPEYPRNILRNHVYGLKKHFKSMELDCGEMKSRFFTPFAHEVGIRENAGGALMLSECNRENGFNVATVVALLYGRKDPSEIQELLEIFEKKTFFGVQTSFTPVKKVDTTFGLILTPFDAQPPSLFFSDRNFSFDNLRVSLDVLSMIQDSLDRNDRSDFLELLAEYLDENMIPDIEKALKKAELLTFTYSTKYLLANGETLDFPPNYRWVSGKVCSRTHGCFH